MKLVLNFLKDKEDRNNFLSTNGFLGMIEMLNVIKKKLRPEKGQVLVFSILLLPLVLGILDVIIEAGNLYVHYWNLQSAADNAALAAVRKSNLSESMNVAKNVADKNNTVKPKRYVNVDESVDPFRIETYTYPNDKYPEYLKDDVDYPYRDSTSDQRFYIKLEKNVPLVFINVFGEEGFPLPPVYAIASKTTQKLVPTNDAEAEEIKREINYIREVAEDGEDKWREVTP